ncbi:hypothetical protein ABI59_21365 [Acidobacteria bacterium Mor1]|nr:hypothetical protein ABI59_21365 [Acidobacteria bacterium Mor1]
MAPPSTAGRLPVLSSRGSALGLSWVEEKDGRAYLRFARLDDGGFGEILDVAQGDDWFVNWADFPSVVLLEEGALAAHWLGRSGEGTYTYDVWFTAMNDEGLWTKPRRPHRDGTQSEHGFVSMVPGGDGTVDLFWLDGRGTVAEPKLPMALRHSSWSATGFGEERVLDPRVCECCQTDAVRLDDGSLLLAYRDRSEGELRDISIVRGDAAGWSEPIQVHADGWKIAGCPVNGPALAASGNRVACAWFTMATGEPEVRLAFSEDGGRSFAPPMRIDGGDPLGRVDLLLNGDEASVIWYERTGEHAGVLMRRVGPDGPRGALLPLGATGGGRPSGFPRAARTAAGTFVAWTDTRSEPSQLKLVRVSDR